MAFSFIDTHLHIWNPDRIIYDWMVKAPQLLNQTFEPMQIVHNAKQIGLEKAILVQASNCIEETLYLLEQAEKYECIAGVVGWVELSEPTIAMSQIEMLLKNPYLKGIRHLIHEEENDEWILQDNVLKSLSVLALNNLTFDIVGTNLKHLSCAIKIAQKLPSLRLIIDHLNQPPTNFDQANEWKEMTKQLTSYPNVFGKISGLTTICQDKKKNSDNMLAWLSFALQTYGHQRLLIGSDWPICLQADDYQTVIKQYIKCLNSIVSPLEAQMIFSLNAEKIYNI